MGKFDWKSGSTASSKVVTVYRLTREMLLNTLYGKMKCEACGREISLGDKVVRVLYGGEQIHYHGHCFNKRNEK